MRGAAHRTIRARPAPSWASSLGLVLIFSSAAIAQISPGPLSEAHRDLEGAGNCLKCHGAGSDAIRDNCLECHEPIRWLIDRQRGLHGTEDARDCAGCHPEHAGRDFELIDWKEGSPEDFDHRRSGWELAGGHATLKCRECHKPAFQVSPVADLIKRKDRSRSWLGLERDCRACHDDRHRGALGTECLQCHSTRKWKPAPGFDHARSRFPLDGRHADVECAKCHLAAHLEQETDAEGRRVPLYKPLPHAECSACHRDPHGGALGARCASCHVTEDFRKVDRSAFDHARTRYPLRGKHRAVRCEQCHDPVKAWGKKPAFASCNSCHADAHAGSATVAGTKTDCATCHRVEGFRPSTFTVEQHRSTDYPLEGKHRQTACDSCHGKHPPGASREKLGSSGVQLRPAHQYCRDCHRDAHGDQLNGRDDGGACESCHLVEGWKPSTFSIDDHARLHLPLLGRHAEVECAACHGPEREHLPPLPGPEILGRARVALALGNVDCVVCHIDPHDGRFGPAGEAPKADGCRQCHGAKSFRPSTVSAATHREFRYALDGSHRAVPCVLCHEELKLAAGQSSLLLAGERQRALPFTTPHARCAECHDGPHGDQFEHREDRGACEGCHVVDAFAPASAFDHDRDSRFPLRGLHATVSCGECHRATTDASERPRVVYRPLSSECRSCHVNDSVARPAPSP